MLLSQVSWRERLYLPCGEDRSVAQTVGNINWGASRDLRYNFRGQLHVILKPIETIERKILQKYLNWCCTQSDLGLTLTNQCRFVYERADLIG